jgi:alkanesulfonate monooxygenase SsuD/methylene tetrahydromethanopterin reductase-like flavin-dependent oxidoreductase (luciferase family)
LRTARHDAHLLPQGPRGAVLDPWEKALRADGRDPARYRVGIIKSCLVTDDPERDWPALREAERYRQSVYQSFRKAGAGGGGVAGNTDEARIPQTWIVGNVEACVAQLSAFITEFGITDVVTWAVPPGLRPEHMAPSLERFARDVAPRLRARFAGA